MASPTKDHKDARAAGESKGPVSVAEMQGHTFAGGPHSRRTFAELFGVKTAEDAAPGELRVSAAAWVKERIEITIDEGADSTPNVIVVERFHTGRSGLASSKTLNLWARNDGLPEELVKRAQLAMRTRLGRLTPENLARIFAVDPDLGASRYEAPPVVAEAREREFDRQAFLFNWGGADMWYQFFATAEYSRARLESLDLLNRATSVNHCDRECLANEPHIPLRVPLTNFPWDDRVRRVAGGRQGLPPAEDLMVGLEGVPEELQPQDPIKGDGGHVDGRPGPPPTGVSGDASLRPIAAHYTELTDYDVIMGGQKKLLDVLNFAIDHLHGDMIFAHVTCIPAVTGEDVDSAIRQAQERSPVPILTLTMTPDAKDVIFGPILVDKRKEAEEAITISVPNAINLIGFPEDVGTSELVGMLRAIGVQVNVVLLPTVQMERVRRLPLAPLHVIHPNEFWQNLYNQLLFDTRIQSINPEAPYGFERTVRWLTEVGKAAGVGVDGLGAVVEAAWAPFRERFETAREEARGHRLAFVVGSDQVRQIAEPGVTWGIPLLGVLEEFGFSLDFMVHAVDQKAGKEAAREIQKGLGAPQRHRVRLFQTPSQLEMLLGSGPFSAVYSEHFFDFRLSRSGKAQFSLNVFERGFGGAVRTLERLLDICRMPLYRRYGKYIGDPFPWATDAEALASIDAQNEEKRRKAGTSAGANAGATRE